MFRVRIRVGLGLVGRASGGCGGANRASGAGGLFYIGLPPFLTNKVLINIKVKC